jgi:hypothetical protein
MNGPAQKQEIIDKFITSAPGLPMAKCGGGIMHECVNMDIKAEGLFLRKPMKKMDIPLGVPNLKTVLFTKADEGLDAFHINGSNLYCFGSLKGSADDTRLELKKCLGDLSLLCYSEGGKKIGLIANGKNKQARKIGMPAPGKITLFTNGAEKSDRKRYVGAEYVVKEHYNSEDVIVRSTGIKRSKGIAGLRGFSLPPSFGEATHIRIWMTDWITLSDDFSASLNSAVESAKSKLGATNLNIANIEAYLEGILKDIKENGSTPEKEETVAIWRAYIKEQEPIQKIRIEAKKQAEDRLAKYSKPNNGSPEEMYLMFEFSVNQTGAIQSVYSNDNDEKWNGNILTNSQEILHFSWAENDWEPSEFSLEVTANEEGKPLEVINIERMPHAIHYSGARLWGVLDDTKIIWSLPAGTPEHEQWDPLAFRDLGLGAIKSIESLGSDIYAFCSRGVAIMPGGDPDREPFCMSTVGGNSIKTFCFDGFGCFAVIDEKLYFLDSQTRAFAMDCKGLDLNMLLGSLASQIKDMAVWAGDFFFIAGEIFKASLKEGRGLTKIAIKEPGNALSFSVIDSGVIIASQNRTYQTFWLYGGKANAGDVIEADIDYNVTLVKTALHGYAEHLGTAVFARLPREYIIFAENICDGLPYVTCPVRQDGMDEPWEYILPAGKHEGIRRPIGKTIGIKITIEPDSLAEIYNGASLPYIQEVKLKTSLQEEVRNPNFNPNRIGPEPGIAAQNHKIFATEKR